jgi:hypothetical protein
MFRSINSGRFKIADSVTRAAESASAFVVSGLDQMFVACWDDFQQYVSGTYTVLAHWLDTSANPNWAGPWLFYLIEYLTAQDDMESYGAGGIAVLSGGTGWNGNGGILTTGTDYLLARDDMESYGAGAITVLDGGTGWNGDGGFV